VPAALQLAVQTLLAVLLAPALFGVVGRTKAFFAGRTGAPLWQPYFDLVKLFRKGTVRSATTTWLFLAGPAALAAAALLGAALLPLGPGSSPIAFGGDAVLFVYALALGRFFVALAALDTGSSFEGMGAAREVSFAALAEPALFFGFLALGKLGGSFSLSGMLDRPLLARWPDGGPAVALVAAAWFLVLLAENSRVPFDDPNTHLELTMVHEVMILDHGGPALGLVLWASMLKFGLFAALVVRLLLPVPESAPAVYAAGLAAGLLVVAIAVGVVESSLARLRLVRVPQLLVSACLLSAFALLLAARS
jgi:formate hydrogenlyase subunit 4